MTLTNAIFRPEDSPHPFGQGNDTAAWQWAIDQARAVRGVAKTNFVSDFLVSEINATNMKSCSIIVPHGASFLAVLQEQQPKPVFDLTGSADCVVSGVRVRSREGVNNPPIIPLTAFLLAESAPGDSDNNTLNKCGSAGPFDACALGVVGSTQNSYRDCSFQQDDSGHPCYVVSTKPDWGLWSAYQNITQQASNVGGQYFDNCRMHGFMGENNGFTGYFRDADNCQFLGGVHDCSGKAHMFFQGSCRDITSIAQKWESEAGHAAENLFYTMYASDECRRLRVLGYNPLDNAFSGPMASGNFPEMAVL